MEYFKLRIFSQLLERVRHPALSRAKCLIAIKLSSCVHLALDSFIGDRLILKRKC